MTIQPIVSSTVAFRFQHINCISIWFFYWRYRKILHILSWFWTVCFNILVKPKMFLVSPTLLIFSFMFTFSIKILFRIWTGFLKLFLSIFLSWSRNFWCSNKSGMIHMKRSLLIMRSQDTFPKSEYLASIGINVLSPRVFDDRFNHMRVQIFSIWHFRSLLLTFDKTAPVHDWPGCLK